MTATYRVNPSADMTMDDVRRFAKMYRLTVETNAPGDGKRRFRFVQGEGNSQRTIGFALGIREAELWLRGYMAGVDSVESPRKSINSNPRARVDRSGHIEFPDDSDPKGRGQFVNDAQGRSWLRDVHLKGTPAEGANFRSYIIFGNEDAPDEIHLYAAKDPTVKDGYYRMVFEDGEFAFGQEIRGK